MEPDSNTFEFYDADPLDLAQDLLQEANISRIKQRSTAKKALEISDRCLDAWLILARSYQRFPHSRDTYLKAIAIGEGEFPAQSDDEPSPRFRSYLQLHKELGACYHQHGDYAAAAETFEKALSLADSDPLSIRNQLVVTYLYDERLNEAEALTRIEPFDGALAAKVAQTWILFQQALPTWSAEQMEELSSELLGRTTWQWMHGHCESLKRHFRAINHVNPFLTFFLINPSCTSIPLPEEIVPGRASEALAVAQAHSQLWQDAALPIRLLEEFPWTNPLKREILPEDKELLLITMEQLETHREQLRAAAERDYLSDNELY